MQTYSLKQELMTDRVYPKLDLRVHMESVEKWNPFLHGTAFSKTQNPVFGYSLTRFVTIKTNYHKERRDDRLLCFNNSKFCIISIQKI